MCTGLPVASWRMAWIRGSESVELSCIEPKPHGAEEASYLGLPDTPRAFVDLFSSQRIVPEWRHHHSGRV